MAEAPAALSPLRRRGLPVSTGFLLTESIYMLNFKTVC
jgi:hypothetical protein